MNNKHIQALELRKQGKTYNEISKELMIAKSTLSFWFKNNPLSLDVKSANQLKIRPLRLDTLGRLNSLRKDESKNRYNSIIQEAIGDFSKFKHEPLFIAGITMYLLYGDKNPSSNTIRLRHSDAAVLKIFVRFAYHYLNITEKNLRFWPLVIGDIQVADCCEYWRNELDLSIDQFYRPQVYKGRKRGGTLLYGIGNIIIGTKLHKTKLLEWVKLARVVLVQ